MAGRTAQPTTTGRFTLICIIILASALACRLRVLSTVTFSSKIAAAPTATTSTPPILRAFAPKYPRAEGRWKVVRASLGLPPVSDRIRAPKKPVPLVTSRFDLRRKRSLEERESHTVPLYFSPDALERRTISLEEFSRHFRTVPPADKEIAAEQARRDETVQG